MKKIVRLISAIVPVLVFFGLTMSCTKDEKDECCTWTDTFGTTYKYCRENQTWQAFYPSWQDVRDEAAKYGGNCDK